MGSLGSVEIILRFVKEDDDDDDDILKWCSKDEVEMGVGIIWILEFLLSVWVRNIGKEEEGGWSSGGGVGEKGRIWFISCLFGFEIWILNLWLLVLDNVGWWNRKEK